MKGANRIIMCVSDNLAILERIDRLIVWLEYEEDLNDFALRKDFRRELNLIKDELKKRGVK